MPIAFVPGARVVHPARASWAEVATKARRIRGAQLTQGPARRRLIWAGYTLLPPFRDLVRFARAPQPAGLRLRAMAVQVALWGVELAEMVRVLILRGPAERR